MELDDVLLDDADRLADADSHGLLITTASAGASIRAAVEAIEDQVCARVAEDGRPRAIAVVGGGGSGAAGEVLAAVVGPRSSVPVITVAQPALPGWIGPTDVVIAVSGSGNTYETLSAASDAARRGARLVTLCPTNSELHAIARATHAGEHIPISIPVTAGTWRARTMFWTLSTPLLFLAEALGLTEGTAQAADQAATMLDEIALECAASRDSVANPAKRAAINLANCVPLIWGTEAIGGVAARRYGRQLAENAGIPAVVGTLPEAGRTQSALLAGPYAGQRSVDDLFRDRVENPDESSRLRLIIMRDADEHPATAALAQAAMDLAHRREVPGDVLVAQMGHPFVRLAELVGVADFATVYAGLAMGIDPMSSSNELDERRQW